MKETDDVGDVARDPYATSDPRMGVWIALIGAGTVSSSARWVALIYAVPYVLVPGLVGLVRRDAEAARRPAPSLRATVGVIALAATAVGFAVGAGPTWWAVVVAGFATSLGLQLASLNRARAR